MDKLRAAVCGIGRVGWLFEKERGKCHSHVGAYLACERIELVAVADTNKERLDQFKQEYPEIAVYESYEKMLYEVKPEILSVAVPTSEHCRVVRNSCRFHNLAIIFVEKPISATIEEAERMVKTCDDFGVKLCVNHTRRWDPAYKQAKGIVDKKVIGELLAFSGRFSGDPIEDGVHMADLFNWFKRGGTKLSLLNVRSPYLVFEVDLVGSDGWIKILDNGAKIEILKPGESKRYAGFNELFHHSNLGASYDFSRAMLNAVDDMVECASGDKQPDCTGVNGMNALKLVIETQGGG